ncbi:MAG: hypothetical protein K6G56_03265 [Clostridiales bacterium]|nr:hypothetical protein [Clostridiales bacterium]
MENDKCTLFTFMTGNVFAAVLHFLCAFSGWCCLVFPILPLLLLVVERHPKARAACIHTAVISLATAALMVVPLLLWLIIRAATHAAGAFYVICTVLFAAIMLILCFALLVIEVACAVKALHNEPVEVPVISSWVEKLAYKVK